MYHTNKRRERRCNNVKASKATSHRQKDRTTVALLQVRGANDTDRDKVATRPADMQEVPVSNRGRRLGFCILGSVHYGGLLQAIIEASKLHPEYRQFWVYNQDSSQLVGVFRRLDPSSYSR